MEHNEQKQPVTGSGKEQLEGIISASTVEIRKGIEAHKMAWLGRNPITLDLFMRLSREDKADLYGAWAETDLSISPIAEMNMDVFRNFLWYLFLRELVEDTKPMFFKPSITYREYYGPEGWQVEEKHRNNSEINNYLHALDCVISVASFPVSKHSRKEQKRKLF